MSRDMLPEPPHWPTTNEYATRIADLQERRMRLTTYELLTLAAVAEFHALCGLDARAEVRRRLAELRERRWQRWVEEWRA